MMIDCHRHTHTWAYCHQHTAIDNIMATWIAESSKSGTTKKKLNRLFFLSSRRKLFIFIFLHYEKNDD